MLFLLPAIVATLATLTMSSSSDRSHPFSLQNSFAITAPLSPALHFASVRQAPRQSDQCPDQSQTCPPGQLCCPGYCCPSTQPFCAVPSLLKFCLDENSKSLCTSPSGSVPGTLCFIHSPNCCPDPVYSHCVASPTHACVNADGFIKCGLDSPQPGVQCGDTCCEDPLRCCADSDGVVSCCAAETAGAFGGPLTVEQPFAQLPADTPGAVVGAQAPAPRPSERPSNTPLASPVLPDLVDTTPPPADMLTPLPSAVVAVSPAPDASVQPVAVPITASPDVTTEIVAVEETQPPADSQMPQPVPVSQTPEAVLEPSPGQSDEDASAVDDTPEPLPATEQTKQPTASIPVDPTLGGPESPEPVDTGIGGPLPVNTTTDTDTPPVEIDDTDDSPGDTDEEIVDAEADEGGDLEQSPEEDDGSVCYPAAATVELEDGSVKRMDQLETGERVRVGSTEFSEVFMWTHRDAAYKGSKYVKVALHGGNMFSASVGHLVYAWRCNLSNVCGKEMIEVEKIERGDAMWVMNGQHGMELNRVENVERAWDHGLFNPQTKHGDIVVDGVLASCYTRFVPVRAAHGLLAPLRALYAWTSASICVSSL